jgi:hypothetical protein
MRAAAAELRHNRLQQAGRQQQTAASDLAGVLAIFQSGEPGQAGASDRAQPGSSGEQEADGAAEGRINAEQLRRLRERQEAIRRETQSLGTAGADSPEHRASVARLASRQRELAEMARRMVPLEQDASDADRLAQLDALIPGTSPSTDDPPAAMASDHPLAPVVDRMQDVQRRLADADLGPRTVEHQRWIVATLDALLDQARQQSLASAEASGDSSASGQPGEAEPSAAGQQPGTQPGRAGAPTGENATGDGGPTVAELPLSQVIERLWNRLPPRQREQLLSRPAERFLPEYAPEIEAYFRRLAEQPGRATTEDR